MKKVLLLLMLILCACSGSLEERLEDLVDAKNKWLFHVRDSDYEFTLTFTGSKGNESKRTIRVENGISSSRVKELSTMKIIFTHILEIYKKDEYSLIVKYNNEFGYPEEIDVNRSFSHSGYKIRIGDFKLIR